jgi:hypothetical protein
MTALAASAPLTAAEIGDAVLSALDKVAAKEKEHA